MDTQTLLTVFVGLTALAILIQACILVAIFVSLRKTAAAMTEAASDLKATIVPLVHSTRALMEQISPQVMTISAGVAELIEVVHRDAKDVRFTVAEVMERVNRQTRRLDTLLTGGLDAVERAGELVETAVALPVRQANGIFAAMKAIVETYRSTIPQRSAGYNDSNPNRDMFV